MEKLNELQNDVQAKINQKINKLIEYQNFMKDKIGEATHLLESEKSNLKKFGLEIQEIKYATKTGVNGDERDLSGDDQLKVSGYLKFRNRKTGFKSKSAIQKFVTRVRTGTGICINPYSLDNTKDIMFDFWV